MFPFLSPHSSSHSEASHHLYKLVGGIWKEWKKTKLYQKSPLSVQFNQRTRKWHIKVDSTSGYYLYPLVEYVAKDDSSVHCTPPQKHTCSFLHNWTNQISIRFKYWGLYFLHCSPVKSLVGSRLSLTSSVTWERVSLLVLVFFTIFFKSMFYKSKSKSVWFTVSMKTLASWTTLSDICDVWAPIIKPLRKSLILFHSSSWYLIRNNWIYTSHYIYPTISTFRANQKLT